MPRRSAGRMSLSSPSRAPSPAPIGRQPGLFGQMAAISDGIAVGHTLGAGEYRDPNQPISTQETAGSNAQPLYGRYNTDRCNLYEKEFLICLDNTNRDSKQCQGFWEALKGSFIIYIPGGS